MSSRSGDIPPVNRQVQENYEVKFAVGEDPATGFRVVVGSTPLRLLLDSLEKIISLETLASAKNVDETTTSPSLSDADASCPVCFETYKIPCNDKDEHKDGNEEAIINPRRAEQAAAASQQLVLNEKPLKLKCGHIIGKKCLRRIFDQARLAKRACPLCRHEIETSSSHIPLAHSNGRPDIAGALCCAIRLYLRISLTKPETCEALNEWVHTQSPQEWELDKQAYFAIMKAAVETWESVGKENMWKWIEARMSGELPDEEF